jgi:hypothetical protein
VAGSDGDIRLGAPLSHQDNGDGTITDKNTKLMWEKKDHLVSTTGQHQSLGGGASGTCGINADCKTGEPAHPQAEPDTRCSSGVSQFNTRPCFAHHCDWRIPKVKELQSIVDYGTYFPPVDAASNNNSTLGCL